MYCLWFFLVISWFHVLHSSFQSIFEKFLCMVWVWFGLVSFFLFPFFAGSCLVSSAPFIDEMFFSHVCSLPLCHKLIAHICVDLLMHSQHCSTGLYVCFPANTGITLYRSLKSRSVVPPVLFCFLRSCLVLNFCFFQRSLITV